MPIDPEQIARIDAQQFPEPTGSARTVRTVHRIDALRSRIPLEAVALAPVPVWRGTGWRILTPLVIPQRQTDQHGAPTAAAYHAPPLAVEWSWPNPQMTQIIDLTAIPQAQQLARSAPSYSARPMAAVAPLSSIEQTQRENALFQALDATLSAPVAEAQQRLYMLAPLYAALLPQEVYPYYWLLAPDSARWLRPEPTPPRTTNPALDAITPQPYTRQPTLPEETVTLPNDPSAALASWLTRAQDLAQRARAREIGEALQGLEARRRLPGFRLAFVGEFNRGKSTLINRLLGRMLLPVGVTPTTATITSLVAGTPDQMEVIYPDGRRETRSLESASWRDITANGTTGAQEDTTFPFVRVTLDHPWLKTLGMELLDTPGAGDLNERRAALVYDALSQSDAAIFLVSALAPFSLTERVFLEGQVLARHVAPVGVVVSQLDKVPLEERAQVLQTARARVGEAAPNVPVLPSQPVDRMTDGQAELEQIRRLIEGLARASDRQVWRGRQIAARLADYVGELETACETGIASARMTTEQREVALRIAHDSERETAHRWDRLQIELDERRVTLETDLRRRIDSAREELFRTLEHDLHRSMNPKLWWEEDLPFYLYSELGYIGRGCESLLLTALARDTQWLQSEMMNLTGSQLRQIVPQQGIVPSVMMDETPQMRLQDMQRVRFFSRVGSGVATVATYFLFGPVGIAVSVGSGLVSEQLINKQVEAQRQVVARELGEGVDRALVSYVQAILQRVRAFYAEFASELREEQETMLRSVSATLITPIPAGVGSPDERSWNALAAEATTLRTEITRALG
ncbi:MAG TPA: dynamin family protein [Polyangiaceae bacterium]|jgi:GTP-binding protein EngB required for normal cell division|nr:dynamin family protein [Polyangiaceae bacterium]